MEQGEEIKEQGEEIKDALTDIPAQIAFLFRGRESEFCARVVDAIEESYPALATQLRGAQNAKTLSQRLGSFAGNVAVGTVSSLAATAVSTHFPELAAKAAPLVKQFFQLLLPKP